MEQSAKQTDTVKVHYTGRLDDGSIFDSSAEREPLQFTIGEGQVIAGFEQAVIGMTPGETKTVTIPADDAYGPYRGEMIIPVGKEEFPPHIEPSVGQRLQVMQGNGQTLIVTVAEVSDNQILLDANHPLAGQDLSFDIRLVEIV